MRRVQKYVWVLLLLLGVQSMVSAMVWTVSHWTDDASTGIDSAKTYTHVINNFGSDDGVVTVNGVVFDNTRNSGSVEAGWTLSGGLWAYDGEANISGDSAGLADGTHFHYNVTELALYGLTPNASYELTFFSVAWEDGTRDVTLRETTSFVFNQDEYGNNNGIKIVGVYFADANGELHLGLTTNFHIYAFANCEYTGDLPVVVSPVSPAEYEGGNRVATDTVLVWDEALSGSLTNPAFDVYLDPNEAKVTAMDAAVLVSSKQSTFSFDPELDPNELYYWRVATYLNITDTEPNQMTDVRSFRSVYLDEHWFDSSWSDDSDSGISAGKVYTHKVNFNASEATSTYVNGVYFENDSDRTGSNWTLGGAGGAASGGHHVVGDGGALVTKMFHGQNALLTLTGLTPGTDYILTKYTRGWGDTGGREVHFVTSADGRTTTIDGNIDGDGNGHLFMYAYTAPASGELVITFDPLVSNDTWHHYAFSNETAVQAYVDPTPLPGASVNSNVELSWTLNGGVVGPTTYNLKVATDAGMSSLVVDLAGLTGTSHTPYLSSDTTYYWQVEIVDDGVVVYTSPVWDFTTTPPQDATMVMEWKFDETTGTIAEQTGPTEDADGILVGFNDPNTPGISHVEGLINNGLLFNGKDEYVNVSDAQVYMPTADGQSFAISGYLRTFDDYGPLFSMRNADDENPIIDIALGMDGVQVQPGKVCLLVRDDAGSISWVNSGITVNDGRWHNFAVTRVGGKWTLYVDGVSRATINGAATGNVNLDFLAIGTSLKWIADDWQPHNSHYRDFNGILDEYTVWDGELQLHQIDALASILPRQGDIDFDLDTDVDDLTDLTTDWLASTWTPVQSTAVLEDMEAYTNDPNTFKDNWMYTPADGSGNLTLSILPDPNGLYGQVMQMDYDFADNLHANVSVIVPNRGANMGLFDRVEVRIKKLPGCDISRIILDFYDGRDKVDPSTDDLYNKGRINIDIDQEVAGEWVTVSGIIPGNDRDLRTCNDLYKVLFSIQDGGEDVGSLLIDSIELTDGTEDCIPVVGEMVPDMNGDCFVDILDFAEIAEGWLNGI